MSPAANADDRQADRLCELLFAEYLSRPVKVGEDTILAAELIVAERGRETGFWKTVLAELKKGNQSNEVQCVRVLGRMLAADASARTAMQRQKETGETSARVPSVFLGPEVVAELLERGKKADRF